MFARSVTVKADPTALDEGIDYILHDAFVAIEQMEGNIGTSLLVDRRSGRCIASSAWESKEAMDATNERLATVRAKAAELMGATEPPDVHHWEVAVMHRVTGAAHPTAARTTWLRMHDRSKIDDGIAVFRQGVLPAAEQMDGFCSGSALIDRSEGLMVATMTFTSQETLEASRAGADGIRARASKEAGAEVLDVAEFELASAHLHLPETV